MASLILNIIFAIRWIALSFDRFLYFIWLSIKKLSSKWWDRIHGIENNSVPFLALRATDRRLNDLFLPTEINFYDKQ